jgi:hypothetical protein
MELRVVDVKISAPRFSGEEVSERFVINGDRGGGIVGLGNSDEGRHRSQTITELPIHVLEKLPPELGGRRAAESPWSKGEPDGEYPLYNHVRVVVRVVGAVENVMVECIEGCERAVFGARLRQMQDAVQLPLRNTSLDISNDGRREHELPGGHIH